MAERCDVHNTDVKNVIIWGNHSSTQYPDVTHGTVAGKPIKEAVADDEWLQGSFISMVQQRGAEIIKVGALRMTPLQACLVPVLACACAQMCSVRGRAWLRPWQGSGTGSCRCAGCIPCVLPSPARLNSTLC